MNPKSITRQTLERLPLYLHYLDSIEQTPGATISSTAIAQALDLSDVLVRKDLAAVCSAGKPRVGYPLRVLKLALSSFLGYQDATDAVLVGAGKLGKALSSYDGFKAYGLNIVAAFDTNISAVPGDHCAVPVFPAERISELCRRMGIRIGIITTPASAAQKTADALVKGGVLAIWNFAPAHLVVAPGILVQNENMAASLAILSQHLKERLENGAAHKHTSDGPSPTQHEGGA